MEQNDNLTNPSAYQELRESDAVSFADWLLEYGYEPSFEKKWVDYSKTGDNRVTSAQLNELFKQQNRTNENS